MATTSPNWLAGENIGRGKRKCRSRFWARNREVSNGTIQVVPFTSRSALETAHLTVGIPRGQTAAPSE